MENKALNSSEGISFREILLKLRDWYNYLLSKWLVIILISIVGAALGIIYAYAQKVSYTATTTFVLENGESTGGLGQYAGLASMAGIDLGGGGGGLFQGDNIIELYKSRSMIEKTLMTETFSDGKKELLADRFIKFNHLHDEWAKNPALKNFTFQHHVASPEAGQLRLRDSLLTSITEIIRKKYLSVSKPDKKLSIIKVEVNAKDEGFAKDFNDQIVNNVNAFYVQTKTKKSMQNVTILQRKVDSVRSVMNGALYTAAAVSDATPNLNITRQMQRTVPVQRSQFTAETNKSILAELVKNLELSKISLLKETPLIQVIDQPVFPLDKIKLGVIKGAVTGMVLAALLTMFSLIIRKAFREVLN